LLLLLLSQLLLSLRFLLLPLLLLALQVLLLSYRLLLLLLLLSLLLLPLPFLLLVRRLVLAPGRNEHRKYHENQQHDHLRESFVDAHVQAPCDLVTVEIISPQLYQPRRKGTIDPHKTMPTDVDFLFQRSFESRLVTYSLINLGGKLDYRECSLFIAAASAPEFCGKSRRPKWQRCQRRTMPITARV
jgi:hypothetical protein